MIKDIKNSWHYIHIDTRETMLLSGWKLYIYGYNLEQSILASNLIYNTVKSYNLTTKSATKDIIKRNSSKLVP